MCNANGVPIDFIREQLGHASLSTTYGYIYNPLTEAESYKMLTAIAPAKSPFYRGDRLRRAKSRCGILTTLAQVGKWKWGWAPSCLILLGSGQRWLTRQSELGAKSLLWTESRCPTK